MDGFLKTLAFILAGLFLLCCTAGLTALFLLKRKGIVGPEQFRALVLDQEELHWLQAKDRRPEEPAERPREVPAADGQVDEREILERIAERVNADRANDLIEQLRRQKSALDDRQEWLDRQNTELSLARADLQRLHRSLEEKEQELKDRLRRLEEERTRWALSQADVVKRTEALSAIERERYAEQARVYEQMKDAAWQSLKHFEPKEIARYLKLMEPKKAAKLLVLAEQDKDLPGVATAIQHAMLNLDPGAKSDEVLRQLAALYAFMKGDQVVSYLKGSDTREVAAILGMLTEQPKKQAEILDALRRSDPDRATEVQRLLVKPAGPAGPAS